MRLKGKRILLPLISVVLFCILCFVIDCSVEAHTVQIKGPNTITLKAGVAKTYNFPIYVDGYKLDDDTPYVPGMGAYSTGGDVTKHSKSLEVEEYDEEETGKPPSYLLILGKKAGKYYIKLEYQQEFEDGTPTITARKKIIVKVKKQKKISLKGDFDYYSTRYKTFDAQITNYSFKPITIYSTNARAINQSYKVFDRKLRIKGKKTIKIKPGKTLKIKFKHSGSSTWYDHEDFVLKVRCKYRGKKYTLKIYPTTYDEETSTDDEGWITIKKGWK